MLHQADDSELDLVSEVQDLVEKLWGLQKARRSAELARLIGAGQATPEQQAEYASLHAQLATSKTGNPDVESRSKL